MIIQLKYNFFKKPSLYGSAHENIEFTTRKTGMITISIKLFEVNFGILDNSNCDKTSEDIANKIVSRTQGDSL